MDKPCPSVAPGVPKDRGLIDRCRGLERHLKERVLGQDEAVEALCDAFLAGELGHTPHDRPRSLVLVLGPTGTGRTKTILEASEYLHGTRALARINVAEFSSAERVPLLLGTGSGQRGLLGEKIDALKAAGGCILLLDEIEKGHRSLSDLLLGMEAAELTLSSGRTLDLSGLHIVATSNIGSEDAIGLEDVAYASLRRHIEEEASHYFRPEVFARFGAVVVFKPLPREAQIAICRHLVDQEAAFQSKVLGERFGHPHQVRVGEGVYRRLTLEGYHRVLGARPMRSVVERRIRAALVSAQLRGALGPGVPSCLLEGSGPNGLRACPVGGTTVQMAREGGLDEVIVD